MTNVTNLETNKGGNVLLRNFGTISKERKVKTSTKLSKQDQEGIARLYDALVPKSEMKNIDVSIVRKFFPTFEYVDVDMIAEEGFPVFEATIGAQNFEKLKRYFGIGCKPKRTLSKPKELDILIAKLRTIKNAQFYISGYKELIEAISKKLEGAPEGLSTLERAKIIRMYVMIFCGYFYFSEDYVYTNVSKGLVDIDYTKVQFNNKKGLLPEELFVMYLQKAKTFADNSIFYDAIYAEIMDLDKRVLKDVLSFAELEMVGGEFISVNEANINQTFGSVRNIKIKVHHEPGVFPVEVFAEKSMAESLDLGDLYLIYKVLTHVDLEEIERKDMPFRKLEGSRVIDTTFPCYNVISDVYIAGPVEKGRFIRLLEMFAQKGLTMKVKHDANDKPLENPIEYNTKLFMSAIKFANDAEYMDFSTNLEREFEVVAKFIEMDKVGALADYADGKLSVQQMKAKLGIDEEFELSYFNIKRPVCHSNIVTKFAVENGYAASEEEVDTTLVENVFVPGNELLIESYYSGEISEEKFEQKIGFTHEFAQMFFALSKIDVAAIEEKLLEIKRSNIGQKKIDHDMKLLVLLYCYIVEEQVPCGPRKRVPKRNKALKPSNLKSLVA